MTKTDPSELGQLVTSELITYLGAGELNGDRVATAIDYSGLSIQNLDQLKQLHFALYDEVVDYVEQFQERLRRIKVEHDRTQETTHGEVRGPVNWQRTVQRRPQTGDPALFVVRNPEIRYDIPENRVVKKLIATIAEPLTADIAGTDREWRSMWEDTDIVGLKRTLEHNVYLDQLPDAREVEVSDRDLTKARRSRHRLYSKGAELYELYDDLRHDRYEREAVRAVLRETIVTPTKDYDLFELFCVFAEIRRLTARFPDLTLQRIEPGMDEVALLDGPDRRVAVYYDRGGPLEFFEELLPADELEREWDVPRSVVRNSMALERHESLAESFLGNSKDHSFYRGRPDVVVTVFEKGEGAPTLTRVRLGEIKYTRSAETFATGLRELLEYLYFAKEAASDEAAPGGRRYLFDEQLPAAAIRGVLYTDGVETATHSVEEIDHQVTDELRELFAPKADS